MSKTKTPVHKWTDDNKEVLVLRFSDKDGKAYGGFQHPMTVGESVTAPDWRKDADCGGGIHGWAWGIGIGDGKEPNWNEGLWQVYGVKPKNIVGKIDDGIKCKFKTGVLRFVGDWYGALMFILDGQKAWVEHFADGTGHSLGDSSAASSTGDSSAASSTGYSSAASSTGYRSAASSTGYRSAASSTGYRSAASSTGDSSAASSTGDSSAASSTGYRSAASSTGYRSAASSTGYRSAASSTGDSSAASSTGDSSAASSTGYRSAASSTGKASAAVVTGIYGKVMAGEYSCIALALWNDDENRYEMRCAEIGCGDGSDGKLKANVWYKLNDKGIFIEV